MKQTPLSKWLAGLAAVAGVLAGCVQTPLPPAGSPWPETRPPAPIVVRAAAAASAVASAPALPASASGAVAEEPVATARIYKGSDQIVGAAPAPKPLQGTAVDLRFEDTPVREAVHALLGDLLKQDYVLYPPVDGRVTIATASQVPPDTAVFMLEAALQANGLVLVRDARGVYHVGKPEALKAVVGAVRVVGREPLPPGHGAVVIPLRYIGAAEMATILRPLAPPDALLRVDTMRNLLVMVGSRAQAEGWLSLVGTFDIDLLSGMSVGVFPLKYASVRDVEMALQMATSAAGRAAAGPQGAAAAAAAAAAEGHPLLGAIRVLPIERLNSVVVVTPRAAYLEEARRWIERLDQPGNSAAEPRLHVYAVRNGSARHLGDVLNGIFGAPASGTGATSTGVAPGQSVVTGSTATGGGAASGNLGLSRNTLGTATNVGQAAQRGGGTSGASQAPVALQLTGNVRIMADELNNAILVYGSPAQYERIEEALRKLDTPPTQVLIEASIIEVTLNDDLAYGVQWLFGEDRGNGSTGTSVLSRSAGGALGGALAGFSYTLRNTLGNVRMVLNALAEKSLVRVISSPSLMVLDNHTAQIVVGNQQPIQTAETLSTDGTLRTSSVQYKDTGVSLAVTPSVGAGDMVTMAVNQSVTDVGSIDAATGQRAFLQRQIGSKVAVRSGETVVLGGLIRDNVSDGSSGVPLLSEIPILGALFGNKTRNGVRTELLVVITPRVARSDEDARDISRALRERLRGLQGMGTEPAPSVRITSPTMSVPATP